MNDYHKPRGFHGYYDIDPGGCWIWRGRPGPIGYVDIKRWGRRWLAHRFAWTYTNGPIPEGMTVDHICFVRNCVNPDHLQLLSHEDNVRRQQRWLNRTHCMSGEHEWVEENIYRSPGNGRSRCRKCQADGLRKRDADRRGEAA